MLTRGVRGATCRRVEITQLEQFHNATLVALDKQSNLRRSAHDMSDEPTRSNDERERVRYEQ